MAENEITLGTLILIIFLIIVNAFFVASEFALVKIRPSQIQRMKKDGSVIAKYVVSVTEDIDRTITSTQIGITLASIALGFIGEPFFKVIIVNMINWTNLALGLEIVIKESTLESIGFIIAYIWVVFLHVVIGELMPKSIAIAKAESVAKSIAIPLHYVNKAFTPLLYIFLRANNILLKILKQDIDVNEHHIAFTEEELKIILKNSIFDKGIEEYEYRYIRNILDFNDMTVRGVITPRVDVRALPVNCSAKDLLSLAVETGFSRIPIYTNDFDDIKKFIHIKDVLPHFLNNNEFSTKNALRDVISVYQETSLNDLLNQMKGKNIQLAIVFDEYGTFSGIVTIEDLLEEIFGSIQDEFDEDLIHEELFEENGHYIVGGLVSIGNFNKYVRNKFEVAIESEDSVTLAGYVLELFQSELPNIGDEVSDLHFDFHIKNMSGNRIDTIIVTPHETIPTNGKDEI